MHMAIENYDTVMSLIFGAAGAACGFCFVQMLKDFAKRIFQKS